MGRNKQYNETELVEGCRKNSRLHQELLYRKYFAKMMYMCLRYTDDRDIAMQIVNNGFLRVFKKIDSFSFRGSLEGWIRKLVYHCLSDYYKKHSKYIQFIVLEEKDDSVQNLPLDNLYEEDILKLVDTLPKATKEVFILYAIDGFTHVEIAKKLGISVGTSKWHLSSARIKLKKLLKQYDEIYKNAG